MRAAWAKQIEVLLTARHRVNDEIAAVVVVHENQLEQMCRTVKPEPKLASGSSCCPMGTRYTGQDADCRMSSSSLPCLRTESRIST